VEVAGATEHILERAAALARERGAEAVSDVDILIACAERGDTVAGAILRQAGVTAERLRTAARLPPPGTQPAPASAPRAEAAAPARAGTHRSGIGYDSHPLTPGGPLLLAGVRIPSELSLVGHSDGDAVAHAVTDALLGAAGAGDIGEMFPDTDEANRGRDSMEMLREAAQRVRALGWEVAGVDVTVILEQPKLAPHRAAMRGALARALGVAAEAVSVKGKTNEGMGWIGRGEGAACIAVATLVARSER
jgi:2-C-methyl-D-erythritol 2,4-cyclodiphosphate synthase